MIGAEEAYRLYYAVLVPRPVLPNAPLSEHLQRRYPHWTAE